MKKNVKVFLSILFLLVISILPAKVLADETNTNNYYLCLSTENYAIKNKNLLTLNDETNLYYIENITLTKNDSFYITDGKGERYYSKTNSEMHVEKTQSLAYTIYFSKDKIFNEENVDKTMCVSDCHFTYALYDKGSYTLRLSDSETVELVFNPYQKEYDSFEAKNIKLTQNQTVSVVKENDENEETVISSITALYDGSYHVIYTPKKTINGNEFAFDKDGKYGSGDDYIYELYLEIEDEYYIQFKNVNYNKGESVLINDEPAYLIERDLEYPNVNKYTTSSFLLSTPDEKIEYQIYSKLPNGYELVDDDNNEDTTATKLTASYVGFYKLTLLEENGIYTSTITINNTDFGDYYLACNKNNYLYDDYGNVDLHSDYKFEKIDDEDDEDYNSKYDQYRLYITVTNDLLNTPVYITNGLDFYRNGTDYIEFKVTGKYVIIFSKDHQYGRAQNYKFSLINDDVEYEDIQISSYEDLLNMIKNCNDNTEYSNNKHFYLTEDVYLKEDTPVIEAFYGIFDGSYHKLYNLTINDEDSHKNIGFIRVLGKTGVIQNLTVENINITAKKSENVGFVGYSYGTISNSKFSGKIEGLTHVGGVVGYNANYKYDDSDNITDSSKSYGYSLITKTTSNILVNGEKFIGGIAGFNGGKIYECINQNKINNVSYKSTKNIEGVGGIAGYSTGIIALCKNYGEIGYKDVANFVGGITGLSTGLFYYDYNYANVNGQHNVGGIVGCYGSLKKNDDYKDYVEETDLDEHFITYVYNTGNIYGSNNIAGIVGWVTETGITLENSISSSDIESKNGSRTGGIVGNFQNGTIKSCFSQGTLKGSGINAGNYIGGIAGYSNGEIKYAYAAVNIIGNDYLGGITGYMTTVAKLYSTISNTLFMAKKEATEYIGYVCGYVEGLPFSDVKNDNIKYNYFIGKDFGGIYKYEFAENANFAAKEISMNDLISKDVVSVYLDINFQGDGFIGGKTDYSYPLLRAFELYDENSEFKADYDLEKLFNDNKNNFQEIEEKYAVVSIEINYFEWNEDNGDLENHENYDLIASYRFFYGDDYSLKPAFIYAKVSDNYYRYNTDKGNYLVNWPLTDIEFKNQNIYAEYKQLVTTLKYNDYLIEGTFLSGTKAEIKEVGNNLVIDFFYNDKEIKIEDYTLKLKKAENKIYSVKIDNTDKEFTPSEYGDYIVIPVTNGAQRIIISTNTYHLPTWLIIIISAFSTMVITIVGAYIYNKCRYKELKKLKK